jgi:hypothetical protein
MASKVRDLKGRRTRQPPLPQLAAVLLTSILLSVLLAGVCQAAPAVPEAARWRPYDIIVDLRALPKRYSCDDLYYKFWEVLWTLGAGSNMKVLTYDCERGQAGLAQRAPSRSPRVELQFSLPEALHGSEARWADLEAVPRTIRLEPGHPRALDASDCALLDQIRITLLPALPAHIVGYRLQCAAPAGRAPFSVSIRTLTPESRGA